MKAEEAKLGVLEDGLSKYQGRATAHSTIFNHLIFLILVDLALGFAAYCSAWTIRIWVPVPLTQDLLAQERWDMVSHPWLIFVVSQIFFLYIFGLYDDLRMIRFREIISFIFMACLIQLVTITSVFYFTNQVFPRTVILFFDSVNFLMLTAWRFHLRSKLRKQILRVLIVGQEPHLAREIIQEIEKNPWMGRQIAGLVLPPNRWVANDSQTNYPVLGQLTEIQEIIVHYNIDEIIFISEESWKDRVLNSLSELQKETPVRIAILPSVYELVIGKLQHVNIHDTPLIEVKRNPNEPFERFIKRVFDSSFAALCLILLWPLFLILALLIKVFAPGPIFYLQDRIGIGGKIFRLIKFRTMIPDAENFSGGILATTNDPRVTSIGSILRPFRIDELPQLVNVLKGDMSFVGPRPERPKFVKAFEKKVSGYSERHKIKPGITGLAQVRGYYHTTAENKLKYDLAYIYNYSFSLDLLILLETIKVALTGKQRVR